MIIIFLFFLGLFIGSFLNVLIDRIPRNESFVKGRSYCEFCKKNLKFFDLIPVVSFIFQKGKCRYCHVSLSFYYPLVEIVTGVMFVFVALNLSFNIYNLTFTTVINLLFLLFIVSSLIAIFFTDLKYGIIPDKILVPVTAATILYMIANIVILACPESPWDPGCASLTRMTMVLPYIISAVAAFLFFLLLFLATRGRGMGFGDVKLVFFMGLFLGFPKIISALYLAFLTGALVSLILILRGKKKFKGGTVPFGPFLILGTMAGFVWGDKIMKILFGI